jgi:protein-L-isoaspartate(D-aspartate) O-methyltransferase
LGVKINVKLWHNKQRSDSLNNTLKEYIFLFLKNRNTPMAEFNFEQARFNMVEQQVRTWEVLNQDVLDLMMRIPREAFVPESYRHLAFADIQIPLGFGQVMMSPKQEGRMLQALALQESDRVLEIGTGSGYLTALLAHCVNHVDTVEYHAELSEKAAVCLKAQNIRNVNQEVGNGLQGYHLEQRYDAIILTGSVPSIPVHFQNQLELGGRLLTIVGHAPIMEASLIRRISETEWIEDSLFELFVPALIGAPKANHFVF